ncbi:CRTAC1 family protein [Flammeovirga pectinis]|uniref:CRTAC1 family protein n=1 Tax=Flammeovirga pectinis TaxID=2494373 RepID=A0A3S9P4S1_9BACT|nr:CRTAC1 family protein [Flammeovirga pectinis]AZQ63205.1 CRTAC1 family protein [Flammeovirga pectinis]
MNKQITLLFLLSIYLIIGGCSRIDTSVLKSAVTLNTALYQHTFKVENTTVKKVFLEIECKGAYANLSIKEGKNTLVDELDIPNKGRHTFSILVDFKNYGIKELSFINKGSEIVLHQLKFSDYEGITIPQFKDISEASGFTTEVTWKYGGPSIGDINNNGYYDFVLNNHDKVPAKLFWNKGNGQVEENKKPLMKWDIHGSAVADYDNDGDLDILISQGGGNGTDPQPPHLLRNDNGTFKHVSKEVGITLGARGRSVRWIDMDLDGDLDLLFINAEGINASDGAQHILYENLGEGKFQNRKSEGIEKAKGERVLVTDINNDQIDDLILFEPLSIWLGNGDFTFSDGSEKWLSKKMQNTEYITGAAAIDIDNDGHLDLYLSRGKTYYQTANKSFDFDPIHQKVDIRDEGNKGVTSMEFDAYGDIVLSNMFLWYRMYDDGFPIYLGSEKVAINSIKEIDSVKVTQEMAKGWSTERTKNGWYFGYLGNGKWKVEWIRNNDIYWDVRLTISGVQSVTTEWNPQNRNVQDILLRNTGNGFVDKSIEWNIPKGGSHQGVTVADFNNDGYSDLFVYRFGFLQSRVTDWLLLNNGRGQFELTTSHGAMDSNDKGHGDMGQAFDYDLDGNVDLLSGSDNYGKWYLYKTLNTNDFNFLEVRVNYSEEKNVDPISAIVIVETASNTYKKRVGSAGEIHSQSLLNTVHFGLGKEDKVKKVTIKWRNGEQCIINTPPINGVVSTPKMK